MYQRIILSLLERMPNGSLTITLPDGKVVQYGQGNGVVADMQIKNPEAFKRAVWYGDIGFGEGYMLGWWDSSNVTNVIKWMISNMEDLPSISGSSKTFSFVNFLKFFNRLGHTFRANSEEGSKKNIVEHYDLGNDFYKLWLDETMTYSSALFKNKEQSLAEAQFEKYDRLCKQLNLQPNDSVLEIGSGWGGFAEHAVKNYGCKVTTVTISDEQFKYAQERFQKSGISNNVDIKLLDYRLIEGKFDKIVSIEMLEAVGHKYLPVYFDKIHQLLKKDGVLALQVIICPDSRYKAIRRGVDWIQKHIFPGSLLPSLSAINTAVNSTSDLTLFDFKEMGQNYAHTLATWRVNFNQKLDEVRAQGYSEQFINKWNYYLCYCEAAFAMRNINVVQMVYVRPNNTNI